VFLKIAGAATLAAGVGVASLDYLVIDVKPERDAPRIVLPVPLFVAETALAFVPDARIGVDVGDAQRYLGVAREVVGELREIPDDTELVRVEDGEETVVVAKRGDELQVRVRSSREQVTVNLPLDSVDEILKSARNGRLDLRRALAGLHRFGRTDLVEVATGEEHVRIYVW
jgi:hypothetical protein